MCNIKENCECKGCKFLYNNEYCLLREDYIDNVEETSDGYEIENIGIYQE